MPTSAYVILAIGWLLWFLPFPITGWNRNTPQSHNPKARWGLLLQSISYAVIWQGRFWLHPPAPWRTALSIILLALAAILSWTATRSLGRHLRFDAALSPDHELIRTGPYRFLRHPIYTSMFCILLGTAAMISTPIPFALATFIFIIGTEIRVHAEDNLLAARFGDQFHHYSQTVSAYIPLIR